MKLHILSDLHTEFGPFEAPETDADAIILAGDIGLGLDGMRWALDRWRDKPILYLAGNHEYYRHTLPGLTGQLRRYAAGTRVRFLENNTEVIGGVRFLGCTLWTDFGLFGAECRDIAMQAAELAMSDYHVIRKSPEMRALSPADTLGVHQASRRWLADQLALPFAGATVVLTHHAPSPRSVQPEYREDPTSAAFASDLEALMSGASAVLWIHGHTHHNVDYAVKGTRIVSNQRGYPHALAAGFDPAKVVEL